MNDEVLVKVENVSKKFCRSLKKSLWYGVQDILTELSGRKIEKELRPDEFWAVKDVSFEVKRGECLALIGPNGAGKSTLLKMLNNLIKPDRGCIRMRGRVGALIELGAGFNPILTGRENIYVNGAVLGLSKAEIDRKFDEIIEFAEIDDFLDTPVQNYSSGMRVRLGFAVAAHMQPDILFIDEVLAVGDVGFRSKCYSAISKLSEETAIIFVSHSMPQVSRLAKETLVLNQGKVNFLGLTKLAVINYHKLFCTNISEIRTGSGEVKINSIKFFNRSNIETNQFGYGEVFIAILEIESKIDLDYLVIDIGFYSIGDEVVAECNNYVNPYKIAINSYEKKTIKITLQELTINPGVYKISAFLLSNNMTRHFDWIQHFKIIEILGRGAIAGQQFKPSWELIN